MMQINIIILVSTYGVLAQRVPKCTCLWFSVSIHDVCMSSVVLLTSMFSFVLAFDISVMLGLFVVFILFVFRGCFCKRPRESFAIESKEKRAPYVVCLVSEIYQGEIIRAESHMGDR